MFDVPRSALLAALALASSFILHPSSFAQGSAFTWQGRLTDGDNPAQGLYDLRFAIWDSVSGGNTVAGPTTNSAVTVNNGLYTVVLDFGSDAFEGSARWLELSVRTNGAVA
jgi:hypothetical protein